MMNDSSLIDRAVAHFERMFKPGEDLFHAVISASESTADGTIAFAGPIYDAGGGFPRSRIGLVTAADDFSFLAQGDHSDSDPQWSPDGRRLAFLSDRGRGSGNYQIHIVDDANFDEPRAGPVLEGEAVESFAWSSDGQRILLQSADAGADAGGSAATATIGSAQTCVPSWAPDVQTGSYDNQWRHARVWNLTNDTVITIGAAGQSVWEAAWCGEDQIVALISSKPTAGGWFRAHIAIAPATGGPFASVLKSNLQIAKLSASPDGRKIAFIEGRFYPVVSLGTLKVFERETGEISIPDIGIEISYHSWVSDGRIFFAGMDMPETVVGTVDLESGAVQEIWRDSGTAGRKVPAAFAAPLDQGKRLGSALIPSHSFNRFPRLLRVTEDGETRIVRDFAHSGSDEILKGLDDCQAIWWQGPDGLEIQGYLAWPKKATAPPPLVAFIHGGPCHLFRNSWSFDNLLPALLVNEGYAVLFPNPRGSSGRGVEFASHVLQDFGGKDSEDIIAGLDHVIDVYGADRSRQFITGGSYGGYQTCWQVTRTDRFIAAAAIAPLTDMRSFFFTAHHPEFLSDYSGASPYEVGGYFDQRSPLLHAEEAHTPTLLIAGGLDRTAPASQASQFHRALILRDVPSECAIYPEEGHAALRYEAQIDQAIRIIGWFKRWEAARAGATENR